MKNRPSAPLIDPAVYYLGAFFLIVGAVIVIGNYLLIQPPAPAHPAHRQFPTENEVHSSIRIGQGEDDIIAQFGQPSSRGSLDNGLEVLNYFEPMSKVPENDKTVYAGFAVYLRDGNVVDVNIIRGSDLRN